MSSIVPGIGSAVLFDEIMVQERSSDKADLNSSDEGREKFSVLCSGEGQVSP